METIDQQDTTSSRRSDSVAAGHLHRLTLNWAVKRSGPRVGHCLSCGLSLPKVGEMEAVDLGASSVPPY